MASSEIAKAVRIGVYVMLVLSAGAAFVLSDWLWEAAREGGLPVWVALAPPCAFSAFILVYAVDRWLLVRRARYPQARALFQVTIALVFAGLLWPHQASELRATRRSERDPDRAVRLLDHRQEDVRATACEVLGLRAQVNARDKLADLAERDPSPLVRRVCQEAHGRLQAVGGDPR